MSQPAPAASASSDSSSTPAILGPHDRAFFGHPSGLLTLFFAEMWERFSYYGMRAILILFMTAMTVEQAQEAISAGTEVDAAKVGGLGFPEANAGVIYGLYTSMVYFAGLAGGWLADNIIGQRKAVFWGGVVIMLGHISLAFHGLPFFFGGLLLIIVGTGLLKPNISTIVGLLYGPTDVRRDSGFAIYYMGINVGSVFGQTVCGFFAQHSWFKEYVLKPIGIEAVASWHWGFAAAAVGMFLGLIVFVWKGNLMRDAGAEPTPPTSPADAERRRRILKIAGGVTCTLLLFVAAWTAVIAFGLISVELDTLLKLVNITFGLLLLALTVISFGRILLFSKLTKEEQRRVTVVLILFFASVLFWGAFEQAGGSLNLFADKKSQLSIGGHEFPSSWYQNINPAGIMLLSPLFAWLWLVLGTRAPSSPAKFSIGLLLVGAGFVVAALGSAVFDRNQAALSPAWLFVVYAMHTIGELFLSPIGLSMVTKLAPQRLVSQVMSIWFMAQANANFLAGQTVTFNKSLGGDTTIFWAIAAVTIGAGVLLAVMTPFIKRLMGGVH